jgi:hypothetical protein
MIKLDINAMPLRRKMELLAKLAGKTIADEIATQAKGFVTEIIKITPPAMGGSTVKENQKRGELAVSRDIRRVYASPGNVFIEIRNKLGEPVARAFWAAYQNGNTAFCSRLMRQAGLSYGVHNFDGGATHQSMRNARGRISRDRIQFLPMQDEDLRGYIGKRVANVGILASGWVAAGRLTGARAPRYASRHGANGTARTQGSKGKLVYVFRNAVNYASENDLDRRSRWVLAKQRRKMETRLKYAVRLASRMARTA